jgi:hypothetical protein
MGMRRARAAIAAMAAGVLVPAVVVVPSWFASAPASEAACIHITINLTGQPTSTCPPSEPGPSLPPINLPNLFTIFTPDGQLNLPPLIVPNEPPPAPRTPVNPIPLPPVD